MNESSILVVEDDAALRDALELTLAAHGYRVSAVGDGPTALARLATEPFQMVVSDLRMAPMDGLSLLAEIRARWPQLPVLLMTAFGDVAQAVAAMRGGACDFLLKPFEPKTLIERIERYATAPMVSGLIAEDARTRELLLIAARVAQTDATVLLTGESGVGKEVFARYLHAQSPRREGPFVAINCAAIPDNLLEATLFGYEKGAFTGATTSQAGKFEQASGGTLLLDEISEMPLALQAKLLRVLQEREVERVGGKKPIPVDCRIIATSNREMAQEVAAGRFREDLFYRINVFPLLVPPLRERPADILPLARHFLARHGGGRRLEFAPEAAAILAAYAWPGNVRELENAIQRAVILATGERIEPAHLVLGEGKVTPSAAATEMSAPSAAPAVLSATPANIKELERQHILDTLARVGGSRKKAAALLGMPERTLRHKLAQYRKEGFAID